MSWRAACLQRGFRLTYLGKTGVGFFASSPDPDTHGRSAHGYHRRRPSVAACLVTTHQRGGIGKRSRGHAGEGNS